MLVYQSNFEKVILNEKNWVVDLSTRNNLVKLEWKPNGLDKKQTLVSEINSMNESKFDALVECH